MNNEISTPILIIGFNRPEHMQKLIEALSLIKPTTVYFAVDGPRDGIDGERQRVIATQNLIKAVSWPSKIETRFLSSNAGCKIAVSSAIDWFFENEEYGIILEDDCIPTFEFISFATRMLIKYANDEHVMHISANSFFIREPNYEFNHYFSKLPGVWGWATWKRAWDKFEFNSTRVGTRTAAELITNYYQNRAISNWFIRYYRESLSPNATTWSPHWTYTIIRNNGLSVMPTVNLVRNIGFTADSTHAYSKSFMAFNDFIFGGFPDLPDPREIVSNNFLDKLRFQVIRKTDPNLFIMRRIKVFMLPKIFKVLPTELKQRAKRLTSKSEMLTKFLQK